MAKRGRFQSVKSYRIEEALNSKINLRKLYKEEIMSDLMSDFSKEIESGDKITFEVDIREIAPIGTLEDKIKLKGELTFERHNK